MNNLQRSLFISVSIMIGLSLLVLSSISRDFFLLQLAWLVVGVVIFFGFRYLDLRPFINYSWAIYGIYAFSIALLIVTYFVAPFTRGQRAWLIFGPFRFQPSEFAKVALVFLLAYFFATSHIRIARMRTIFISGVLTMIPMGLVMLQPDLGSGIVFGLLWLSFLLLSGLPLRYLMSFLIFAIVLGIFGWYNLLAPYQKDRIIALVNPDRDLLGVNWNVNQSKIAIGSAGFWGKGYGQGTQSQLGFLPEAHSDFIFAALIEEWGLIVGIIYLLDFTYFIFITLKIGVQSSTNFERFVVLGAATIFCVHFAINIGSAIGLLPVIGLPLAFMSYGGSNLVSSFFLFGMIYGIAGKV
ncbi:MAG: FtsW/RodA/SpoVE family cell cycle protein [bacterium]|nr:FtsW/RodA/SpoVE family cell cycle protein [bacterium]